jgi:excisionase family DNA binding protein
MGFENLMTLKEVAGLLRVSPQTLYKLLEQGAIPALKIGNQWRFDRDRVNQWLEQGSTLSPEETYQSRSA